MKRSTKTLVWLGSVGAGVWAWMRYGSRASIAASRVAPPGYLRSENVVDATGRQVAVRFIYPAVESDSVGKFARVLTVPIDATQRGVWSALRVPSRAAI